MSKAIYHITPFTLLDYPDKTACIVWFAGCNMRCRYCYNIDIVKGKGNLEYDKAIAFINSRKNLLDGVVLSGGECMLHCKIDGFIKEIKKLNFLLKIDTNGSNPRMLQYLIKECLVDYVALDFKSLADQFFFITKSDLFTKFEKTLDILIGSSIPFEVRTTVHSKLINIEYLKKMLQYLETKKYGGTYYIQNFLNDTPTLAAIENDYQKIKPDDLSSNSIKIIIRNE
ncbi:MAG: anaerobic ribonucleoside-triphosphate reductase activating protein [Saprospiraceae bacterium]|nr:anaerobic ribonucleoside-triphosphate reductase activating protein [Saprospiraceae bacterium]